MKKVKSNLFDSLVLVLVGILIYLPIYAQDTDTIAALAGAAVLPEVGDYPEHKLEIVAPVAVRAPALTEGQP